MSEDKKIQTGTIIAIAAGAFTILGLVIAFIIWLFFMHTVTVEPGSHAVLIDKPYFFGHEGVREEPLKEGRKMLFKTTTAEQVRMTPLSHTVRVDDYSSKDNILLDFDTSIQFRILNAPKLIDSFGSGWFDNNISLQYLAVVREAVKKKSMSEMMSDVSAAQDVDDEVTKGLKKIVVDSGLPIEILGVSLGRAKPNEAVLAQMNETAQQQQRKKTLVEATQAERQREQEQIAKARADNAYRNAMQLTPEMFLELERIKLYSEACRYQSATCIIGTAQMPTIVPKK